MAAVSNLVPNLGAVSFTPLDYLGMALFALATVGYHTLYSLWTDRHPLDTVKGKTHLYRRTWVKRILDRDDQMLAVQSLRNLLMTSSFMASSALLVVAVILNSLLGQGAAPPDPELDLKLLFLAVIYGYAFFSFLLSTRYLNHFTILVGADPDLIGSVEPVDAVSFLTNILNRAGTRFTMGQRAFYFSLPAVAWIVDTAAFLLLTVAVFGYLALFLDFKKWRPPFPLRPPGEDAPPPAPPASGGPLRARDASPDRRSP